MIHNVDCFNYLREVKCWWDTIFADPPDGIGLDYDGFDDTIDDYESYIRDFIRLCRLKCNYLWLSFNPLQVGAVARASYDFNWSFKPCVQVFTFGQHNHYDLGTNHRYLWRFGNGPLFPDKIRIESERQRIGDKRADPRGRVPGDVFDFPRVTGNSSQRRAWHKTQLHEGLVERCLLLTTPHKGRVLDTFAGTGTVHRVCNRLGFDCTSLEISETYYSQLLKELP